MLWRVIRLLLDHPDDPATLTGEAIHIATPFGSSVECAVGVDYNADRPPSVSTSREVVQRCVRPVVTGLRQFEKVAITVGAVTKRGAVETSGCIDAETCLGTTGETWECVEDVVIPGIAR